MLRSSLKRPLDAYDSPASSTPPRDAKRLYIDSDASSDSFAFHLPSDSPSNPFARVKPFNPRTLPCATPISEHLILRFQLASQSTSVHRIVAVPVNYTFWHLSRLTQFLFGWKDLRTQRSAFSRSRNISRRVEHVFTIQKRVLFFAAQRHAGLIKSGETVVRVAGDVKRVKARCNDGVKWEREESYMLQQLWHRPGRSSEMSRAIIYDYDVLSSRKELVHITMSTEPDKFRSLHPDLDELSNTPYVIVGQGLPDDDDDDDFALDLQQWNETAAFENYILSQEENEEGEEENDSPSSARLAEEQARVRRRMTAPLPPRLPMDEDEHEDPEGDEPFNKDAVPKAPMKKRKSMPLGIRLPDPDESREVGVYYPKELDAQPRLLAKRRAARLSIPESREVGVHHSDESAARAPALGHSPTKKRLAQLPDPNERREVGVEYLDKQLAARRRSNSSARLPGHEESRTIGTWLDNFNKKARMTIDTRVHMMPKEPAALHQPVKQLPLHEGDRRVVAAARIKREDCGLVESETEL